MFGNSVALSGDTAIVGLSADQTNAVYVYQRAGTMWSQQAMLVPSDGAKGDRFGSAVAVDDNTTVIGASEKTIGPNSAQGQAYVFVRSGTMWDEEAKFTASDGAANSKYGSTVSISGDTALIGAYKTTVGNNAAQGAAYVYVRSGTTWSEQAKLTASDGAAQDQFGISVSVSGDTAGVGANQAEVNGNPGQGAAYVFARTDTTWSQYAKLISSNGSGNDSFGAAIALSTGGNTALVGAFLKTLTINPAQGEAYVYGLEPQPDGSACVTGSDCLSGSCMTGVCIAATAGTMDMGVASHGGQLALIGSGVSSGAGCSLSASRSATTGLFGVLFALFALALLRPRKRGV
jgi:hypothetical protein